jgi:hypothetical protein
LSEAETKEFAKKCAKNNVTFTAAVSAATAKAVQGIRTAQDGFLFDLTFAVDLRRYTTEIPNGQIGMFTMWIETITPLFKNQSFWDIAAVYKNRLHKNLFNGNISKYRNFDWI